MIRITKLSELSTPGGGLVRVAGGSDLVRWSGAHIPPDSTQEFDPIDEAHVGAVFIRGDVEVMRGPHAVPIRSGAEGWTFGRLSSGPLEIVNPFRRPALVMLATVEASGAERSHDKFTEFASVRPVDLPEEWILGQLLPGGPHFSAAVGIVLPNTKQRPHWHDRPGDGVESVLMFAGSGLLTGGRAHELSAEECPLLVEVPSGEPASFVNPTGTPLRFLTVFAPPYQPGEITWVG